MTLIKYKIILAPTFVRNNEPHVVLPHEFLDKLYEKKQAEIGNCEQEKQS
jgi:hypothetical protein